MSGLACARALGDFGHEVRVYDKARGPGGRTSTRRERHLRFDHGAQYFTVRDDRFRRVVDSWRDSGVVAPWQGRIAVVTDHGITAKKDGPERLVGVPAMNAMAKHLASGLQVAYGVRIDRIEPAGCGFRLATADDHSLPDVDAVVVSAPPLQSADLLRESAPDLAASAREVEMTPCWAVMLGLAKPIEVAFDGAFVNGGPLSWVARDSSKPGRDRNPETWVLHATPQWSADHLEQNPESAGREMCSAFEALTGAAIEPIHVAAHRWRFAQPVEPLPQGRLADDSGRILVCGDWCGGPRVEGAYLSGVAAAHRLLE